MAMKRFFWAATVLWFSFGVAGAAVRHDRPCDAAQDHPENFNFNPQGGNAIMLGGCGDVQDAAAGALKSRAAWWGAFSCGYFAYREGRRREAPYTNKELIGFWIRGWGEAAKACKTGKPPFRSP
jgi:hypothetical protein